MQQDSHELLRLLLDGLHNEEVKAAKAKSKSKGDKSNSKPTAGTGEVLPLKT